MKKIIYLSESIDNSRKNIVREYFEKEAAKKGADIQNSINNICTRFLENYYKRTLGEFWRKDLINKYEIPQSKIAVVSEKKLPGTSILRDVFFGNSYFNITQLSENVYPNLEGINLVREFSKDRSKKIVMSLIYEKIELENQIIKEFKKEKILNNTQFLPGIDTFGDLKRDFPQILDTWIQYLLQKLEYSQIEVVETQDEIDWLKTFLV